MEPFAAQCAFSDETSQTRWVDIDEARQMIGLTTAPAGVTRDLAVLDAAYKAFAKLAAVPK